MKRKTVDLTGYQPTTIVALYEKLATECGEAGDDVHFDCTKCEVSSNIADAIFAHYESLGVIKEEVGMNWVCYGPKAIDTLPDNTCVVEEGFFVKE